MRSIGVNLRITMYNRSFPAAVCDVGDRCVLRGRVKCGCILFPVRLLLLFWVRSTTSMAFERVGIIRDGYRYRTPSSRPSQHLLALPGPQAGCTDVQSHPSGFPPSQCCGFPGFSPLSFSRENNEISSKYQQLLYSLRIRKFIYL